LTVSKKKTQKQKTEYVEGGRARRNFEATMKALFQVPKTDSKKPQKGKD